MTYKSTASTKKPRLILIRGLPGSGKSTFARTFKDFVHLEADMFFEDEKGRHCYDGSKIKDAHKWCMGKTKTHLSSGHNVVVSNTFSRRWEVQFYLDIAEHFGIIPEIILCKGHFTSTHNLTEEYIQRMIERWETIERENIYIPTDTKKAEKYPDDIMKAVRQNLNLGPDDESQDDYIMKMSKDEVLNRVAQWNNLLGFGPTIRRWVESIWGVDLSAD